MEPPAVTATAAAPQLAPSSADRKRKEAERLASEAKKYARIVEKRKQAAKGRAFAPISFRHSFYNLSRLAGGQTELLCILYVLSETEGASRAEGAPPPKESRPISVDELALYTRQSVRAAQDAMEDLCKRRVITRRKVRSGMYAFGAPIETWDSLDDYVAPQVSKKPAASAEELDSMSDDEREKEEPGLGIVRWTTEPVAFKAGRPTKAIEVPGKVEKVQIASNASGQIEGELKRGILRLSIRMGMVANSGTSMGEQQANDKRGIPRIDLLSHAAATLDDAVQARGAPLAAAVSGRESAVEVASARELLNRWFQPALGPVDDDLVRKAIAARGPASWPDCMKKLQARAKAGYCKTWGGVLQVISDVGAAAHRAGRAAPTFSAEELRDAQEFLERQKSV
jgi:hypothetical protein